MAGVPHLRITDKIEIESRENDYEGRNYFSRWV